MEEHPFIRDSNKESSILVNIAYTLPGEVYSATFIFMKRSEKVHEIHVINSHLLSGDRLSYNRDPYGFQIQSGNMMECLKISLRYILASKIHQKTVGTLTKNDVINIESSEYNPEYISFFWGATNYLETQSRRGSEKPISDTIDYIRDTAGTINKLRIVQWLEGNYLLIGKTEEYRRIIDGYSDMEKLAENTDEEANEFIDILFQ